MTVLPSEGTRDVLGHSHAPKDYHWTSTQRLGLALPTAPPNPQHEALADAFPSLFQSTLLIRGSFPGHGPTHPYFCAAAWLSPSLKASLSLHASPLPPSMSQWNAAVGPGVCVQCGLDAAQAASNPHCPTASKLFCQPRLN